MAPFWLAAVSHISICQTTRLAAHSKLLLKLAALATEVLGTIHTQAAGKEGARSEGTRPSHWRQGI